MRPPPPSLATCWRYSYPLHRLREELFYRAWLEPFLRPVERLTPCLFGLYSVVALVYAEHIRVTGMGAGMGVKHAITTARPWYDRLEPTFIDALEQVRWLLRDRLFATPSWNHVLQKLPPALREHLLEFRPRVA